MTTSLIIQGNVLPTHLLEQAAELTRADSIIPCPPQAVKMPGALRTPDFNTLIPKLEAEHLDWGFIPAEKSFNDFKLIAFDMDSTLITIECIDELADFAGKKEEVSAVTEAAMRGEIDYKESLGRRLALLAGLDARILARVYGERLLLSPGVRELLEAAHASEIRTAIISGGFTYFTERLRIELGFDFATSNELEISGGKITGRVVGDIVDATAKAQHLARLTKELGIAREAVIAIGDGANDLLMMDEAGLSVAYRAKPATQEKADVALNCSGLNGLLNFL